MKMSAKFAFFMVALLQGYSANAERIFSDRLGGSLNVHSANTNKNSQERSHTSSKKEQNRIGSAEHQAELSKILGAWASGAVTAVGQFGGLATEAAVAGLGTQVAALGSTVSAAAGPIMSIAASTGLSVGAVSTIVTSGALAGPLLGSAALVVACWPKKADDPFVQIEGRMAQMIDGAFDKERQRKLGARLKRYLREFARCTAVFAQMATASVPKNVGQRRPVLEGDEYDDYDETLPKPGKEALMEFHNHMKKIGAFDHRSNISSASASSGKKSSGSSLHAPRCMVQLERIMSLERDEWMAKEGHSVDALFMPFATLHIQLQGFLKAYPPAGPEPSYDEPLEQTAAEYSGFILGGIHNAWKAQVCRQVRLRELKYRLIEPKYQLTLLRPAYQPNPAKDCSEKCGGKDGWCNFCGGPGVGACCKKGEFGSPECRNFDTPMDYGFLGRAPYYACVHTDCEQQGTEYWPQFHSLDVQNWAECQEQCKQDLQCSHFSFYEVPIDVDADEAKVDMKNCFLSDESSVRWKKIGSTSGPRECPKESLTKTAGPASPHDSGAVPSDELTPCEMSGFVSNADFNENSPKWAAYLKNCSKRVLKLALEDFNPYYSRFIKAAENFARRAGCSLPLSEAEEEHEDRTMISDTMLFGRFSDCDWSRPKTGSGSKTWYPDPERAIGGLLSHSKVNLERQRQLPGFSGPTWLERRTQLFECLESKFPGSVDEMSGDDVGNLEEMIMTSAEKYEETENADVDAKKTGEEDGIMHLPTIDTSDKKVVDDDDDDVVPVPASTTPAPVVNAIEKWCVDNFSKTVATCSKLENQNCYPGFTGYKLCERVFQRKCKRANPCCEARNATNGKVELECAPKPSISKAAAEIP
eukprot:TRINITY_DN10411_c0_g1_i1.p1 TRINITY_DN10411_c0_g1~~TRINITY_DN10411_c0_g1_i1.p1  ORF type:complete len:869 (+),score=171.96 TRINITY_DN10411_c0_g1_i1:106-2712(+)